MATTAASSATLSGPTVAFDVRDDWTTGFIGTMTLDAAQALDGWTISFAADFDISNIWNAEIVSHVGNIYVVRNAAWNGTVPADGAVSFGFQASPGGGSASADAFTVNGTAVGGSEPAPPVLSVADAQVVEGNDGTVQLAFTVTLSAASDGPVSVHYATADGTASAGSDYTARSGTLSFAAGQTSKTILVSVNGDTAVEASETLKLTLSAPSGATLGDALATGTILNDDVAPPVVPVVSVAGTRVVEGDPGSGGAAGWFSTSGNQIVDAAGQAVKIAGVNWFGFESSNAAPHGLWTRGYQDMMDQMKELGFNTIRLPFSSDMLDATSASGIDYAQNPDLKGLTPLQIMDKIVDYAGEIGLKVILDHHRSSAGSGTSDNGLWYDATHSAADWVADWQMLAARYADDPTVIGADLHNEPYAGTWGGGGATDWAAAAERAGDAIGSVNPNWLIFVEGVGTYAGESYWWGGNLMGVRDRPIELAIDDKVVYSAHDYGHSVYAQPWFQSSDFAAELPEKFRQMWGYIYEENIAPVYVGEFGTKLEDPKDAPWLEALTSYMAGDFNNDGTLDIPAGQQGISWTYWSWNPNSGDTGGILADDWRTVHTEKLAYLEAIQSDLPDAGDGGGAEAVFVVSLSAAASAAVTVDYHTLAGSAGTADFTAASGSLTFAAGETTKLVSVPITGDTLAEGHEQFSLVLTDADGAVIGVAEAVATIVDDDAAAPVLPTLRIADAQVQEGGAGAGGLLAFTLALSAASSEAVTVSYHTTDGTAQAGSDFTGLSGTFVIPAGATKAVLQVPVIGDGTVEANETFALVLTGAEGATIADGTATGTILNDDTAPVGGNTVAFDITNDWGSGFVGTMTVSAASALNGWTVGFDAPFDISNIWNAEIVSHVGDHYVVRNAAWNGTVAASGNVSFGFQASPGAQEAVASGFTVNGIPSAQTTPASSASAATVSQLATAALADDTLLTAVLAHVETSAEAFTADVTLANSGDAAQAWTLEIDTPFELTGVSGAAILSHSAEGYLLGPAPGSGPLAADATLSITLAGAGTFDPTHFGLVI